MSVSKECNVDLFNNVLIHITPIVVEKNLHKYIAYNSSFAYVSLNLLPADETHN